MCGATRRLQSSPTSSSMSSRNMTRQLNRRGTKLGSLRIMPGARSRAWQEGHRYYALEPRSELDLHLEVNHAHTDALRTGGGGGDSTWVECLL